MLATRPLICRRVELQEDLVIATRNVEREAGVAPNYNAACESFREARLDDACWPWVQPVGRQPERMRHVGGGFGQTGGKRISLNIVALRHEGGNVQVARRAVDEPEEHQAAAANSDQFER